MHPRARLWLLLGSVSVALLLGLPASAAYASGTWPWPVSGPVIRGFDPPASAFGSGHRGIDIASPFGTPILAPEVGTVTFAGTVAGHLFLTIAHGGGVASTYSWLSELLVLEGDVVTRGQAVALTGSGHPADLTPSLHLGVKLGDTYVDPLDYLVALDVSDFIRLAPL